MDISVRIHRMRLLGRMNGCVKVRRLMKFAAAIVLITLTAILIWSSRAQGENEAGIPYVERQRPTAVGLCRAADGRRDYRVHQA